MNAYISSIRRFTEKSVHKIMLNEPIVILLGSKREELSYMDFLILKEIDHSSGLAIHQLVKNLNANRTKVAESVKRLTRQDFIGKNKVGREVNLVLHPKGKTVLERGIAYENEFYEFVLKDTTANEQKAILKFLSRVSQKT